MVAETIRSRLKAWAGLIVGSASWAVSTQANYALVTVMCVAGVRLAFWLAVVLVLASLAASVVSFSQWRRLPPSDGSMVVSAAVGALAGLLFAAVVVLQGMATTVFTGCER